MECPNFVSVRVVQVVYDCIDNGPSISIINISPPMQQRDIEQPSQKTLSPPNITLAFLTLPKWRPQLAQEGTTASLCVHPPETNRANTALLVVAILFLRLGWTTRAGLVRKNAKK